MTREDGTGLGIGAVQFFKSDTCLRLSYNCVCWSVLDFQQEYDVAFIHWWCKEGSIRQLLTEGSLVY